MKVIFKKSDKTYLANSGTHAILKENNTYFEDNKELFKKQFGMTEEEWGEKIELYLDDELPEVAKIMQGYIPQLSEDSRSLVNMENWDKNQYLLAKESKKTAKDELKSKLEKGEASTAELQEALAKLIK